MDKLWLLEKTRRDNPVEQVDVAPEKKEKLHPAQEARGSFGGVGRIDEDTREFASSRRTGERVFSQAARSLRTAPSLEGFCVMSWLSVERG